MRRLFFLLLSIPWLIGCNPVYTTHLVSGANSFETDKRLIGSWNLGRLHIEHDAATDKLYGIQHDGICEVTPIYTTRIDDQWFMNVDVAGKFRCASFEKVFTEDARLWEFDELYQLVAYRIKAIPVEEILPIVDEFLQTLRETHLQDFIEFANELEESFGVKLELADIEELRKWLGRLTTIVSKSSEDGQRLILEVLDIESMPYKTALRSIRTNRLSGMYLPDPDAIQYDHGKVVITDTAENIRFLLQIMKLNFPDELQTDQDEVEKKGPFERLEKLIEFELDIFSTDPPNFYRLTFGGDVLL